MTTTSARNAAPPDPLALDNQLCFAVYSVGLAFNRLYKPLLDALNLTYPQYLVMMALWQQDGQLVGELAERLFLESSTLTPLLKRLENAGYVTRQRNPADERQVQVRLTETGRELRQQALACPATVVEASGRSLEQLMRMKEEAVRLRDSLNAFTARRE